MQAIQVIYTIWLRDFKAFFRERGRMIGMIGQPLLYLLILGPGIASGLTLNQAPGVGYLQFMFPGIMAMSVLFTSMFSAISIIWDREFGFLKAVLVAPVPSWAVAVGKILGGATIAVLQSMILLLVAPLAGIRPSPLMVVNVLLLCLLIGVAVTSLGTAIAARMRSVQSFQIIMNLLVMPLYFLSGAMFPLASAPPWMRTLMVLDPLTYGVDALRNLVLTRTTLPAASATLAVLVQRSVLLDVSILGFLAAALVGVAVFQFRRDGRHRNQHNGLIQRRILQRIMKWAGVCNSLALLAVATVSMWYEFMLNIGPLYLGFSWGRVYSLWDGNGEFLRASTVNEHPAILDALRPVGLVPAFWSGSSNWFVSIPLWILFALSALVTALLWWRDRRRLKPGHCSRCGYDLTGSVSGRCSECGAHVAAAARRRGASSRRDKADSIDSEAITHE